MAVERLPLKGLLKGRPMRLATRLASGLAPGPAIGLAVGLAMGFMVGATSYAQSLTPRAYWPAPKGLKLVTLAYQYSTGDILTDPSLPIVGLDSRLSLAQLSYQQSFSLAGRTANAQINLPYTWGTNAGEILGETRRRTISGWADVTARLSVNLLGAPTMDRAAFQELRANPRPILGVSLDLLAPTGGYEPGRLINVGSNRWAIKPALGYIYPMRRKWLAEFDLGVWIFGDNDEFLGTTREQNPIASGEFHLIKRVRPGFWFSLDLNYYYGGRSTVGGVLRADLQRNSRAGGTLVFPFRRHHAIRASYSTGTVTTSGGDFEILSLVYVYAWN